MAPTLTPLGMIGEAEGIETNISPCRWDYAVGDVMKAHAHGMPHASLVACGRFLFTDERTGGTRTVGPLTWIPVAAKDLHGFECLEAGTIFCVFAGPGADVA